ncbi:S-methyl-5-thioribose kinase [Clostridium aestuarii]|uniref:S-methyl-5-thioribose kinase n=1 Tax=Clostridium aestuarii TaxID=338193 RepID=A0ABT4D414_9CLOT|nr:S-methyl-5-thioribose kinase [Clostridium aestuarii]MCY6485877.1 S-methyl-5-thioribose kinase [Clostridium aestuarii]
MGNYYELSCESVVKYVNEKLDFFSEDAVYECNEIGDGNLNLVFRVKDTKNNKSIIVKQALSYVRAAGEDWPLDIGRGVIETKILQIEYKLSEGLVPKVYCFDDDMFCIIMEDLLDYIIMRYGLLGFETYPNFAEQISDFLVKTLLLTSDVVMDHKDKKKRVKEFINPELCEITEDLVYTEPFNIGARNDMEEFLVDFHKKELVDDKELKLEVAKLKFDFMNNAQALLHGDLHTGSIFTNKENTKVIDPEFAFYGPMAYDIGALIANIIMNYISTKAILEEGSKKEKHLNYLLKITRDVVNLFREKSLKIWDEVVTDKMAKTPGFKEWYIDDVLINTAGVVGCEMIRRTVGFAHVKDLDSIPNDILREKAKKNNILLAKEFIKGRKNIISGEDYIQLIKKFI